MYQKTCDLRIMLYHICGVILKFKNPTYILSLIHNNPPTNMLPTNQNKICQIQDSYKSIKQIQSHVFS